MTTRRDYIQPQAGPMGFANTMKTIGRVVTITAADNVTGNIVAAFKVPAGFIATGIIAVSTDLDAGSNAMTLSVGDATLGTRYLNASVIGQAGTSTQTMAAPVGLFLYTVDTEILITFTLGATVPAAGTITLYLSGFMAQ